MEYRTSCAESEEEKAKESNFMGLGLTSRKNLCIHPEVSDYCLAVLFLIIVFLGIEGKEGEGG